MKSLINIIPASALALLGFCYYQNNGLKTTKIKLKTNLKEDIHIIQLSDLHSKEFGKGNIHLYNHILKLNPDIIFLTGDIIDSNLKNMNKILSFVISLNKLCPIFYIPGNNEARTDKLPYIMDTLKKYGIFALSNEIKTLKIKDQEVNILGLAEHLVKTTAPGLSKVLDTYHYEGYKKLLTTLENLDGYKILLSHYPEKFSLKGDYSKYNFDLMLSGHAHGGQFIIPKVGGLFAPGQGILPKFYAGLYKGNGNNLIVSRGLGNSGFPLRLFNRPDIVSITLETNI
ncbi:MAG: metallophosphoesterase [Sarcina sp.]